MSSLPRNKFPSYLIELLAKDYARAYFKRNTESSLWARVEDKILARAEAIYKMQYVDPLDRQDRKDKKMPKKKGSKKTPKKMK